MLCPDQIVKHSEFYSDFLQPLDAFNQVCGCVFKEQSVVSLIASLRPARVGPFDEDEIRLVQLLMPHLQRALKIHGRFSEQQAQKTSLVDCLDQLSDSVFLLTSTGRVVFANRSASQLVSRNDGLSVRKGNLEAARNGENVALRRLILNSAAGKLETLRGEAFSISRPSFRRPYALWACPVPENKFFAKVAGPPRVAIFVTDPENSVRPNNEILRRLFGLTPSEACVAAAMAQGKGILEICEELSITRNTARTHMKHLFEKTGVRRQGELVSLLLRSCGSRRTAP
jgi:DNA-binding CsgD family transcriptional regulator